MITTQETAEILKEFGKTEKDSGSSAVQVAILTKRINNLMDHFKSHKHDYHSNRGLMLMIGKRKAHLKYLIKKEPDTYKQVIQKLGLRK